MTLSTTPDSSTHRFVNTINGRAVDGESRIEVINPATGRVCATVPEATAEHLQLAVAAARRAQPGWAALDVAERRRIVGLIGQVLTDHRSELANLLVQEQGKPLARAFDEVDRAAKQLELLLAIDLHDDETVDSLNRPVRIQYRPLGVVGAIAPWNMPLVLSVPKIVHALYTGNTVVLKPSPFTPLATLRMGELVAPLLPPGILNVIAGGNDIGRLMSEDPGIDKIAFTGSVQTGKHVMRSAASTLKRITLELGGNDPAIVFDDVDPVKIAPRLFAAAFANSGQICMAVKRLYVHERIYEALCQALAAIAERTVVGDGAAAQSQLGPVQNKMQFDLVRSLLDDARAAGGRVLGGPDKVAGQPGYCMRPLIVADLKEGTRLVDEEQFGPVLPVLSFSDTEDVIRRANATQFGLGASVWSRDLARAQHVADRLDAGSVWINHHIGTDVCVPFGGAKLSGFGCQYSLEGLRRFMQAHAVYSPVSLD